MVDQRQMLVVGGYLLFKLLLQVFDVVHLEVLVESQAIDEVFMANSAHDRNYIDVVAAIFDFKVISDEWIVFEANCDHLFVGTDVEAKWLAVVVFALEGKRHLNRL